MRGNELIDHVVAALHGLGGYFVFRDSAGEEFVMVAKKDLDQVAAKNNEVQLTLPPTPEPSTAYQLLDKINRDIALYQAAQEELYDDLAAIPAPTAKETAPLPPPRRVRFEPLRGDLPPELQE